MSKIETLKLFSCLLALQLLRDVSTAGKEENTTVQDKLVIRYQNASLITVKAGLNSYNRTTKVISATFLFKKILSDDAKHLVSVYKFSDNTYKKSAIEFSIYMKAKKYDNDLMAYVQEVRKYCHPVIPFPPKVNVTYQIIDFIPDADILPRFIQIGKWRADITLSDGDLIYFITEYHFEIKPKEGFVRPK